MPGGTVQRLMGLGLAYAVVSEMRRSVSDLCHCGQSLHYSDPRLEQLMREVVADLGELMLVSCEGRRWLAPRHYIALHGLSGAALPCMDFQESTDTVH
jgi:hypothetical protein